MMNNNWSGLVIDGSVKNIERVMNSDYYWRHDLTAIGKFITRDNINEIIRQAGITGDIVLLSIDLDGNGYWILNNIRCINPRIVICEYNSIFGSDKAVTVPYDSSFVRQEKHYSYLYWRVSLKALCLWAEKMNIILLGQTVLEIMPFLLKRNSYIKIFFQGVQSMLKVNTGRVGM
ncbi:MAG: hypothetical protein HDR17_13225 [Lachnospiraceae bacterium]|nr:hypothetical protein [Lachnospiraceae bacterium]